MKSNNTALAKKFGTVWGELPRWLSGKESACQCRSHRRCGFNPWVRKIPWRRKWQPTPVFLPGKSQGQRSLVCYSPWGCKESDVTEWAQKVRFDFCKMVWKTWTNFLPNLIFAVFQYFVSPWQPKTCPGTSLVVQWLRIHTPNAGGWRFNPWVKN